MQPVLSTMLLSICLLYTSTKAGALHLVGAGAFLAGKGVKKGLLVGLAHANAVILHHKAVSGVYSVPQSPAQIKG